MVNMTDRFRFIKDVQAKLFVVGLAFVAAVVSALVPVNPGVAVPILVFLSVTACCGLTFAWTRADAAAKKAEQAASQITSRYVLLANRLIKLEQQLRPPSANSASRPTMAEVSDTVGLLGGAVRELTRNVAAQSRDVSDLNEPLKAAPGAQASESSAPELAPKPAAPAAPRPTVDEMRRTRLVTQAFEADWIELHLQPIVALPQRKIRFYEALARLRLADGTLLGPAEFLPCLEGLGRAAEFDRRILDRAIAVARHLVARGSEAIVGVNLSPQAIDAPGFLWSLVGMMDAGPEILGRIVLELPQESWRSLGTDQRAALVALRERGVPLSLDRAVDLNFDAKALADDGLRFLKLPAELMLAEAEREEDGLAGSEFGVRDFTQILRREGIRLIAEHVEREETVPALIELGVPLAQGFVFAAPRAVKAEVLGGAASESERNLLRRAG